MQADDVPLLEVLKLDAFNRDGHFIRERSRFPFLSLAPRLHTLTLNNCVGSPQTLPCSRLVRLTIGGGQVVPVANAPKLIVACPLLEFCRLYVTESFLIFPVGPEVLPPDLAPTRCNSIHTLEIDTDGDGRCLNTLFERLTLPSLTKLTLDAQPEKRRGQLTMPPFHGMLLRSACPLKSLTLRNVPASDTNLLACLELVPALEELSVTEWSSMAPLSIMLRYPAALTNDLLRRLSTLQPPKYEEYLCPALRRVKFDISRFSADALLDFVYERMSSNRRLLEVVEVGFALSNPPPSEASLEMLNEQFEGLQLTTWIENERGD
ncbi:hypothetical protein HGRIS_006315 [Hohenbuehelia grisea]|uniref:Uncharacterized protein n=1 Tax=Hohenbuehelia grisea TaxID=104357 RepID=A0ABR3K0I8_9AGAR